ncbi:MAG: tetratricopeptide repeat protein, partial [Alkalinema sp. RL_2_19]|nr:tetratricopeptide repeat protein [Alkalinema sp. RL_2_19]
LAERQAQIDQLERLLTELQYNSDNERRPEILTKLASLYRELGEVDRAKPKLEEALALEDVQPVPTATKARTLYELSRISHQQGEISLALTQAQTAADIAHQQQDYRIETDALTVMAYITAQQGDVATALSSYEQMLSLCEQSDYEYGKAATLNNMAQVIAQQGDIDRALNLWQQSLDLKERIGDVQGKAATLNNMAMWRVKQAIPNAS